MKLRSCKWSFVIISQFNVARGASSLIEPKTERRCSVIAVSIFQQIMVACLTFDAHPLPEHVSRLTLNCKVLNCFTVDTASIKSI